MKLVGYKRHLAQFGPDGLIEVARQDPDMIGQITELESAIVRWRWRNVADEVVMRDGRRVLQYHRRKDDEGYVTEDDSTITCACGCGRDLPPHRVNLGGNQKHPSIYFNQACKQRAYRRRRQGQIK